VQTEPLKVLLEGNFCPTICSITHDKKGQLLNTNADTIAREIAGGLASIYEVSLRYCFEFNGVLLDRKNEESIISEIDKNRFLELKSIGIVADGMIPKLENAFSSIEAGVKEVVICGISNMFSPEKATRIRNAERCSANQ